MRQRGAGVERPAAEPPSGGRDGETMAKESRVCTRPPRLVPGDTIGIAAPASAFAPAVPPVLLAAFQRGLDFLRRDGYEVRIAPHVLDAGTGSYLPAQQRAEDLNGFIEDPAVKAIVSVLGGYGAAAVLPLLNWAALARPIPSRQHR
jgi:muramoyltetrapeptide carboxypeptidase